MNDLMPDQDELTDPAGEPADSALASAAPARPADIPEKFWDAEAGAVRADVLLRSYLELERKLGSMIPLPAADDVEGRTRLHRVLGCPETADGYEISAVDERLAPDPTINQRLHRAGFTAEQAQLVYDLAHEHLQPIVENALAEMACVHDAERLKARFGGEARWAEIARQIKVWGQANLEADVYAALVSSYGGVVALEQMMHASEPALARQGDGLAQALNEESLKAMMRDPRYWRERNPAFVAQVTEGFRKLFPT